MVAFLVNAFEMAQLKVKSKTIQGWRANALICGKRLLIFQFFQKFSLWFIAKSYLFHLAQLAL